MMHGQVEFGDVGADAFVTARRVDDDDAGAGRQHAEHRCHVGGCVAQQDSDLGTRLYRGGDLPAQAAELRPGEPVAVVLDRPGRGIQFEDLADPPAQRVVGH